MSFPKAKLKRFNDLSASTPGVGDYNPKLMENKGAGLVPFDKCESDRFKEAKALDFDVYSLHPSTSSVKKSASTKCSSYKGKFHARIAPGAVNLPSHDEEFSKLHQIISNLSEEIKEKDELICLLKEELECLRISSSKNDEDYGQLPIMVNKPVEESHAQLPIVLNEPVKELQVEELYQETEKFVKAHCSDIYRLSNADDEIFQLQTDFAEARCLLDTANLIIEELRSQLAQKTSEIEEITVQVQRDMEEIKLQLSSREMELQTKCNHFNAIEEKLGYANQIIAENEKELAEEKQKMGSYLFQHDSQVENLKSQIFAAKEEKDQLQEHILKLARAKSQLEAESEVNLSYANQEIEALSVLVENLKQNQKFSQELEIGLKSALKEQKEEMSELKEQSKGLELKLEEKVQNELKLHQVIDNFKEEIEAFRKDYDAARLQIVKQDDVIRSELEKASELQNEVDILQECNRKLFEADELKESEMIKVHNCLENARSLEISLKNSLAETEALLIAKDCFEREQSNEMRGLVENNAALMDELQGLKEELRLKLEAWNLGQIDKEETIKHLENNLKENNFQEKESLLLSAMEEIQALKMSANAQWQSLYEELLEKVAPFSELLDQFSKERAALLKENNAALGQLQALEEQQSKIMGHQNHKQKIKYVVKLQEDYSALKLEVSKLRDENFKQMMALKKFQTPSKQRPEFATPSTASKSKGKTLQAKENVPQPPAFF